MSEITHFSSTAPILERVNHLEDVVTGIVKGSPSYVLTTASFIQPAALKQVQIKVGATDWLQAGNLLQIYDLVSGKGGYYKVISVVDEDELVVENQAYTYNTTGAGQTIPAGARVQMSSGQPDFRAIIYSILIGLDKTVPIVAGGTQQFFTLQMPNTDHCAELILRLHVKQIGFPIVRRYWVLNKTGEPTLWVEKMDREKVSTLAGNQSIDFTYATSGSDSVIFSIDAAALSTDRTAQSRILINPFSSDSGANIVFA